MVRRLAVLKAERIAAELPEAIVVAADTTVVVDGAALAKPNDEQEACAMLMRLQGRSHEVLTGFCVRRGSEERADVVRTEVVFRPLSRHAVEAYVATGESLDKAGGYGIQGAGGALVERVSGSYSNVVGLPISEVLEAVAELACGGSKRSS